MDEIIHYTFCEEIFNKIDKVEISEKGELKHYVINHTILPTVDDLKKAMSNGESVNVNRCTFVVSENTNKNTISLKGYFLNKTFKEIKNLKFKKFVLNYKILISLTINKSTGDFSIYKKHFSRGGKHIFVRKNISNSKTKNILREFKDRAPKLNIDNIIGLFYEKLGYPNLALDYNGIIHHFFDINPEDKYNRPSITIFPFLNYLKVKNINVFSYHSLYYFESIFIKNKSKYKNCTIIDYMSDYYKIYDKILLVEILDSLIKKNEQNFDTLEDQFNWCGKAQYNLYIIDYVKFKLLYDLFFSKSDSYNLTREEIYDQLFTKSHFQLCEFKYQKLLDILKLYNFSLFDILLYSDRLETICNDLIMFNIFGVKLKIKDFLEYYQNKPFLTTITQSLFDSANETGIIYLDKKSLDRIKLYFKNYKLEFLRLNRFKKIENFFLDESEYQPQSVELSFYVYGKKGVKTKFKLIPITYSIYQMDNENSNQGRNFLNAYNSNKNGLASSLKYKILFSRKYFEELCHQNNVNFELYIDYLTDYH